VPDDIVPEHFCDGDLIQLEASTQDVRVVLCSACGTEFAELGHDGAAGDAKLMEEMKELLLILLGG
jgi:hypothetical protein